MERNKKVKKSLILSTRANEVVDFAVEVSPLVGKRTIQSEIVSELLEVGIKSHPVFAKAYNEVEEAVLEIITQTATPCRLADMLSEAAQLSEEQLNYDKLYTIGDIWYEENLKNKLLERVIRESFNGEIKHTSYITFYEKCVFKRLWKFVLAMYFHNYEDVEDLRDYLIDTIIERTDSDITFKDKIDVGNETIEDLKVQFMQGLEEGSLEFSEKVNDYEVEYFNFIRNNAELYFKRLHEKSTEIEVSEDSGKSFRNILLSMKFMK